MQANQIAWGWSLILGLSVLGSVGLPAQAQSGFVFSGSEDVDVLKYKLDFDGAEGRLDRYRLDVPAQDVAVAEVQINMGPRFDSTVKTDKVRLEVEGKSVDLADVYWNEEFKSLEVIAQDPVASGQSMRVVISELRNPDSGIYRFEGRVLGTEANPIFRLVGNWLIDIQNQRDLSQD